MNLPIDPAMHSGFSSRRRLLRSRHGFSLVEVTLAVAVAALAIITLLGLLPQGLEMSRKTSLITNNSSIVEQIIHDLDNVRWASMPTGKQTKYFNNEGISQAAGSDDIAFVAEMDFNNTASLPQTDVQTYLRRVVIRVAATSSPSFKFTDDNRVAYVTFNHLVAKTR